MQNSELSLCFAPFLAVKQKETARWQNIFRPANRYHSTPVPRLHNWSENNLNKKTVEGLDSGPLQQLCCLKEINHEANSSEKADNILSKPTETVAGKLESSFMSRSSILCHSPSWFKPNQKLSTTQQLTHYSRMGRGGESVEM